MTLQNVSSYAEISAPRIREWLSALLTSLAPTATSLGVRFVGDRAMQEINRQYRHQYATTDVLSFPGEKTCDGNHVGDILLCVPAARRQARALGCDVNREIRLLLLHGVLHCLGWDHKEDEGEMEKREEKLRDQWLPS